MLLHTIETAKYGSAQNGPAQGQSQP
jgi:hypothetical protein